MDIFVGRCGSWPLLTHANESFLAPNGTGNWTGSRNSATQMHFIFFLEKNTLILANVSWHLWCFLLFVLGWGFSSPVFLFFPSMYYVWPSRCRIPYGVSKQAGFFFFFCTNAFICWGFLSSVQQSFSLSTAQGMRKETKTKQKEKKWHGGDP